MQKMFVAAALVSAALTAGSAAAASAAYKDPLDARTLSTIRSRFSELMELANRHDLKALHGMFWQSPSVLLVAKNAIPSEGNWAGFWGNDAVDRKLHDIAASGPVVLTPDLLRLKVVGLTRDVAESYAPMNITVSYAGQFVFASAKTARGSTPGRSVSPTRSATPPPSSSITPPSGPPPLRRPASAIRRSSRPGSAGARIGSSRPPLHSANPCVTY